MDQPTPFFDVLFTRRSVRHYTSQPLAAGTKERLIAAADAAPSAHGRKPWRFAVVDHRPGLEALVKRMPWFRPSLEAPLSILVLGAPADCVTPGYWTVDCAAATQNLLLAARSLGLGSVWMGLTPIAENVVHFGECFAIPEGLIPFSLVALGYPLDETAFQQPGSSVDRTTLVGLSPRPL